MSKKGRDLSFKQFQNQRYKVNCFIDQEQKKQINSMPTGKVVNSQAKASNESVNEKKMMSYKSYLQEEQEQYFSDLNMDNVYFETKRVDQEFQEYQQKSDREDNPSRQKMLRSIESRQNSQKQLKGKQNQKQVNALNANTEISEKKVMKFLKYTIRNSQNCQPYIERQRAYTLVNEPLRDESPTLKKLKTEIGNERVSQKNPVQQENYRSTNQNFFRPQQNQREEHHYYLNHAKKDIKISTQALCFENINQNSGSESATNSGGFETNFKFVQPQRRKSLINNNNITQNSFNNTNNNSNGTNHYKNELQSSYMQRFFIPKLRLNCQSSQQQKRQMNISSSVNRIRAYTVTTAQIQANKVTHDQMNQTDILKTQENENSMSLLDKFNNQRAIQIKEVELCLPQESLMQEYNFITKDSSKSNKFTNSNQPFNTFYSNKQSKNIQTENMYLPMQKKENIRNSQNYNSQKESSSDSERRSAMQQSQLSHRDLISATSQSTLHQQKQFQINKLTFQKNPFFYQSVKNNPSLINYVEKNNTQIKQIQNINQQTCQETQIMTERQKSFSVNSLSNCNQVDKQSKTKQSHQENQEEIEYLKSDNQQQIHQIKQQQNESQYQQNDQQQQFNRSGILKEHDLNQKQNSTHQRQFQENTLKKPLKIYSNVQQILLPLKPAEELQKTKALDLTTLSRIQINGEKGNHLLKKQFKRTLNISNYNNENCLQEQNTSLLQQNQQQKLNQINGEKLNIINPLKQLKMIYQPFQVTVKNVKNGNYNMENNLNFYS
ncbi:hypothetical protein TTHERM_00962110 (macronuclear) [Tetrahymena thermophila SB210]|uniref:Uncharacterized protein n=1 Tax=Tetrahymena thermophila (strain SB210) TaxID=312017 RepID=Q23TX6_TETTS|nr:hypothetical protein TTHERM_00962110 [Tetrahymena thermophila SB210]EAS00005.1 hypothetical protein TTHERM_00962110 [Tetrahymena thermophila SB210]|eukprot:XP_001020250.1 hypothetical protein TTHERM_00962110 [Tetrahymena thermophila SB210]